MRNAGETDRRLRPPAFSAPKTYVALAVLVGILPFLVLAFFSYHQSQAENQKEIDGAVDLVARRVVEILDKAESVLRENAGIVDGRCGDETLAALARIAYLNPTIREIGIVWDYRLVCTSWGRPDPPIALNPDDENLRGEGLNLYAIDEPVTGFAAQSLVMGYRIADGNKINALIFPETVYRLLDGFAISAVNVGLLLGEDRLLAGRVDANYREFPASTPVEDYFPLDGYLHTEREISGFPLKIVAHLPEDLKYKHLIPQFTLYLCGALFVSLTVLWLSGRLFGYFRSMPVQLQSALAQKQLKLLYQPVVDMESSRCLGMEALLRWEHPRYGMLGPNLFVPMAEKTMVMGPVTEWVLDEAIRELEGLLARNRELFVAINLCAQNLVGEAFLEAAVERIRGSKIHPRQVHFELTERTLFSDDDSAKRMAARLRQEGFLLAIDDFGTGYSTLNALREIRVDLLKIERGFVEAAGTCAVSAQLVDSIVEMGNKLGLTIIAEGVETAEQVQYMVAKGVTMGQGYYFSKPVPAAALLELIGNGQRCLGATD